MKLKINKDQNFCDIHANSECTQTSNHNCICVMCLLTQLVYSYILMSPNFIVKVRKKQKQNSMSLSYFNLLTCCHMNTQSYELMSLQVWYTGTWVVLYCNKLQLTICISCACQELNIRLITCYEGHFG